MLYGEPVYMFRFPNMTAPDGSSRSFDNEPSVTIPHEFNHGHDGDVDAEAIVYPEGFDGTIVSPRLKVFIFYISSVFVVFLITASSFSR